MLQHPAYSQPSVSDASLNIEAIATDLSAPTSFAFLDNRDILILEKEGTVRLISEGLLQEEPVLSVTVNTESERGLLGIAVKNSDVFLYYTESAGSDLRNRIYKYQWDGQKLINPTILLDLPAIPGPNHDGGKILLDSTGNLYTVIGDLNHDGKLQNFVDGPDPDDTGVILRINSNDGSAVSDNPFNDINGMENYYAYGIRNSFGIDIDPVNGNLWDTENGPSDYDEINIVNPGFNSGWQTVMGPIGRTDSTESELMNFPGSQYSDPVFSWLIPPAITDLEFFASSNFGDQYLNNLFVGDNNNGNLYYFTINESRNGFELNGDVSDKVVDNENELSSIIFGQGFDRITDIETGPDGNLYVLSFGGDALYRISSTNNTSATTPSSVASSGQDNED
jgi:glucose/arabinose dehydrogenase